MQLVNEITVAADIERTWATLLDIERVATCLPGATLQPADESGTFRGDMKVKIGPMTVAYEGTARLAEVDEDDRIAAIEVRGREVMGQGTAAATITNRLIDRAESTTVIVETDLVVTGRPAQFGRSIMQDIAGKLLTDFASRLEQQIVAEPAGHASGAVPESPREPARLDRPTALRGDEHALQLGGFIAGPLARRALPAIGVFVLLLVLLRRRRP